MRMSIDRHVIAPVAAVRRLGRTPRVGALGVVLLASTLLAACGAPAAQPVPPVTVTPTIEASRTTPPEPVVPPAPIIWPLTGVLTDAVANRPAVAIKIENTHLARPQSGLEQADVVWETIVEFDVSRLIAVFQSQVPTEVVGPVRSVRPMDPLIVAPLHGPLVYSGGQAGILALIPRAGIQSISHDAGAAGLARISSRAAPHNVYGNVATFMASADATHNAPPPPQFAFAESAAAATALVSGTPATNLDFTLSSQSVPRWVWDAASGLWLRSEGSTAAMAAGGARLTATNVVAITAAHPPSGFGAQAGASVPTYSLVGEGSATVATGGRTIAATWRKAAEDQPMQLVAADGSPVLLAPGNTWVELVPQGSGSLAIS